MAKSKAKISKAKSPKPAEGGATRHGEYGIPDNLAITIAGTNMVATGREFKTGSCGYFGNGKILVGDKGVKCQVSLSVTVVGSKDKK